MNSGFLFNIKNFFNRIIYTFFYFNNYVSVYSQHPSEGFVMLPILIGSKSDLVFMADGLKHLDRLQVCYEVVVSSTHREPRQTSDKILALLTEHKDIKVMKIGRAHV